MKKKFMTAAIGIVAFQLLLVFLFYQLWFSPHMSGASLEEIPGMTIKGILLFAAIYLLGMLFLGLYLYKNIVIPIAKAQEKLKAAAEENAKVETMRKEFVANVSHELNTPLTSILGFIETLQAGAAEKPEIRTKFIDIIAIETSRLKRLIEDLLVLSDIENKKDPTKVARIDARIAIDQTIQALEMVAADKKVEIIQELNQNVIILGNADRFKQMMYNLIENAIKYSSEDSRVWVKTIVKDNKTIIMVKDEGIGIEQQHLERLFERFYRVDQSRSKKVGGTGLGLSIVKHITALLNAELKVESKVGEGTIFYVLFER